MQAIERLEQEYIAMRQTVGLQNLRRRMRRDAEVFAQTHDISQEIPSLTSLELIRSLRLAAYIQTHVKRQKEVERVYNFYLNPPLGF